MAAITKREPSEEKRAYWRRIFDDWQATGLNQIEYCRRHTLSITKFRWWRKRLQPSPPEPPFFVPVRVAGEAPGPGDTAHIEIVLPRGFIIRVRPGFDAESLSRVIVLLEEPSCG